ncbi:hypothetical protein B2J86_08850 [Acidovorax sp. SRB_14]|uniref:Bug family tripartite tricarboxylate transporter substrate binding protein n=1 Tax=Acidovorax sp. SRB_14 TaxID=1962699 RepID=UPI001564E5DC|nr:tripartite tricarboxylate transporter substrate binding protein [Acidovorax sp. SRB_14]NMM81027.1 hypothetical protein [Acidovorax sp. SRB_14]
MKSILACLAMTALTVASPASFAQTGQPTLTMIVPYTAGGSSDSIVRAMGQAITRQHNIPVVVDNKPGGGTYIGAQSLLSKPADGHTVFMMGSSTVINPYLLGKAPYDVARDFAPVSGVAENPHVLVVNPSVPAKTVQEYLAFAKERKDASFYSSFGNGSSGHLGFELFKRKTGITPSHAPYKGGAPALMAVLSGEVNATFADVGTAAPHIAAGKLRALGVVGPKRSPALPDVPTFGEAGVPGITSQSWFVMVARNGTPPAQLARLTEILGESLKDAEVKKALAAQGMEPLNMAPSAISSFLKDEGLKFQTVIREAKIQAD